MGNPRFQDLGRYEAKNNGLMKRGKRGVRRVNEYFERKTFKI